MGSCKQSGCRVPNFRAPPTLSHDKALGYIVIVQVAID